MKKTLATFAILTVLAGMSSSFAEAKTPFKNFHLKRHSKPAVEKTINNTAKTTGGAAPIVAKKTTAKAPVKSPVKKRIKK